MLPVVLTPLDFLPALRKQEEENCCQTEWTPCKLIFCALSFIFFLFGTLLVMIKRKKGQCRMPWEAVRGIKS